MPALQEDFHAANTDIQKRQPPKRCTVGSCNSVLLQACRRICSRSCPYDGGESKDGAKIEQNIPSARKELGTHVFAWASEWDETISTTQWVLGGVSRQLKQCLLQVVPDRRGDTLIPLVERHSDPNGLVFTDEWLGYLGLSNHMTVCHAREFTNSQATFVHTNTQEGIWGHLKPLSWHIYRGIPRNSLPQFLSEVMFRYNIREYQTRVSVLSALLTRKINSLLV